MAGAFLLQRNSLDLIDDPELLILEFIQSRHIRSDFLQLSRLIEDIERHDLLPEIPLVDRCSQDGLIYRLQLRQREFRREDVLGDIRVFESPVQAVLRVFDNPLVIECDIMVIQAVILDQLDFREIGILQEILLIDERVVRDCHDMSSCVSILLSECV